jgi:hypothetical protein
MTDKQDKDKSKSKSDIEFILDYSGVLTEDDLDFLAHLFARAIIRRMKRSQGLEQAHKDAMDDSTPPA